MPKELKIWAHLNLFGSNLDNNDKLNFFFFFFLTFKFIAIHGLHEMHMLRERDFKIF